MSMYTERDAKTIIRALYGPDFKFRFTVGCTIGVRPVHDSRPMLAWRKAATGKNSMVHIGECSRAGAIDWQWAVESRQLSQVTP